MGHNLNFIKLLIAASMIDNINNLSPNNLRTGKTLPPDYKVKDLSPNNLRTGKTLSPDYKVKDPDFRRQEREFNINGVKVMAYSRKDAIQRLKHKNKRK